LEPAFVLKVRALNLQGSVSRVSLALEGLPAMPEGSDGKPVVRLRIAPTVDYLERAFDDAKWGRLPAQPPLDVVVPTVADPQLAPSGKHVLTAHVQYTPYHLRKGAWDDWREELGALVVELLDEALPGLRSRVLHREVYTPVDLERKLRVTGGHLYHGEMVPNQLFSLRPVPGWAQYRTPIDGLYLCGSGAHPGGGITGAPGFNAAQRILKDWSRASRPSR
jgi:phytoene dehydrogenase-like protein